MFFSLFGCEKKKEISLEQTAQRYLEKKYGEKFEVGELDRRGTSGPFRDYDYTGTAWIADQPTLPFDVWVNKDGATVHDTYYCVKVMKAVDVWMQSQADTIWPESKVRDQITLLRYQEDDDYADGDIQRFFRQESYTNEIKLLLPADYLEQERIDEQLYNFLMAIADAGNGTVSVYFVDGANFAEMNLYDTSVELLSAFRISTGASQVHIQEILEKAR